MYDMLPDETVQFKYLPSQIIHSPRALTEAACVQEQLAAVVKATGNASEGRMATKPEQRDRAPGLEDALHGKAPVLEDVLPLPQKGKQSVVIQRLCYRGTLSQCLRRGTDHEM